jgi:hypothetical protein
MEGEPGAAGGGILNGGAGGDPNKDKDKGGAPAGSGTPPTKVEFPVNWKDGLPDDLKGEEALKIIQDIPGLAKSYINAQKMVGADKVVLPGKNATEEDWNQFFQKVGAPKEAKDMEIKLPEKATFDAEFVDAFKDAATKAGLVPKQAQKLVDWFNTANGTKAAALLEKSKETEQGYLKELKTEFGQAFDKKVTEANLALATLDPKGEIPKLLAAQGLQSHPALVRFFAQVGEQMREDGTIKGGGDPAITPAEAKKQMAAIFSDMNHPYYNKDHAGHRQAVEEVQKLMMYQTVS